MKNSIVTWLQIHNLIPVLIAIFAFFTSLALISNVTKTTDAGLGSLRDDVTACQLRVTALESKLSSISAVLSPTPTRRTISNVAPISGQSGVFTPVTK